MSSWKSRPVSHHYLAGVRGAIPLAAEQIDLMLRIINSGDITVSRFMDVGSGDGVLAHALFEEFPAASGVLVDFSQPMIEKAIERFSTTRFQPEILLLDYGDPAWVSTVSGNGVFDVIVSGFSIHHLPDLKKKRMYRDIFDLLRQGGLFLNLEHVASTSRWGTEVFDEAFIDALYRYQLCQTDSISYDAIATTYRERADQEDNKLALVEDQCSWLREIGFERVDCYFKYLELALFGGYRPI